MQISTLNFADIDLDLLLCFWSYVIKIQTFCINLYAAFNFEPDLLPVLKLHPWSFFIKNISVILILHCDVLVLRWAINGHHGPFVIYNENIWQFEIIISPSHRSIPILFSPKRSLSITMSSPLFVWYNKNIYRSLKRVTSMTVPILG